MYDCFHGNDAVFAYLFSSMRVKKKYSFAIDFQKECACMYKSHGTLNDTSDSVIYFVF